ncbi:ribosome recycling factor [Symbiobacterium thermophilum]|uniref:ribosome recycling factor n=1 Tax=Symbiobacterium thermophilum TaxID=2734 RepID=UPI0035C71771
MTKEIIKDAEERMKKAVEVFRQEVAGMRANRATPALLDKVRVEAYGSEVPVNNVATIEVPDPRTLVIKPWDRSLIKAIERAINASDLGLNPTNDGQVIRLSIPPMTEERRRELVKVVAKRTEEQRVAIRNIRRDANEQIKKLEKDKAVSEDESKRAQDEVQKLTDKYIKEVDQLMAAKEKEIMEV